MLIAVIIIVVVLLVMVNLGVFSHMTFMLMPLLRYDMGAQVYTPTRAAAGFAIFALSLANTQILMILFGAFGILAEDAPRWSQWQFRLFLFLLIVYIVRIMVHFVLLFRRDINRIYSHYVGTSVFTRFFPKLKNHYVRRWIEPAVVIVLFFVLLQAGLLLGGGGFFIMVVLSVIHSVYIEWSIYYRKWQRAKQPVDVKFHTKDMVEWSGDKDYGGAAEEERQRNADDEHIVGRL